MSIQSLLVLTSFFIVAFTPLWVILIVNYTLTDHPNWYVVIGASLFIIGIFVSVVVRLTKWSKEVVPNTEVLHIRDHANITQDAAFYTLGYFPALFLNSYDAREIITFSIILLTIYTLYVKINMWHINPILALMKYKMYKVTDDRGNTITLISKLNLMNEMRFTFRMIANNLNLVVEQTRSNRSE